MLNIHDYPRGKKVSYKDYIGMIVECNWLNETVEVHWLNEKPEVGYYFYAWDRKIGEDCHISNLKILENS